MAVFFDARAKNLVPRLKKYVEVNGDYVERYYKHVNHFSTVKVTSIFTHKMCLIIKRTVKAK